jgi:hypothetical protein
MADLDVQEISTSDHALIEKIGRLRVRAWETEIPDVVHMGTWLDKFDEVGRHWAVFRDGEPIAAARMTVHQSLADVPEPEVYVGVFPAPLPDPIASINRLVVEPSARGLGLSRKLDLCRIEAAEVCGCRCIVGETPSGIHRVRQLESLGFKNAGGGAPYFEPMFYASRSSVVLVCFLPRPASKHDNARTDQAVR